MDELFDEAITLGPLIEGEEQIFNADIATIGSIGFGSTGYDQFQGSAFTLG